jgi:hypothetical protein
LAVSQNRFNKVAQLPCSLGLPNRQVIFIFSSSKENHEILSPQRTQRAQSFLKKKKLFLDLPKKFIIFQFGLSTLFSAPFSASPLSQEFFYLGDRRQGGLGAEPGRG